MREVRVRWRGLGRVALGVAVALAALRLLPGLLTPPDPPPLATDVGLPRPAAAGGNPRFEMHEGRAKGTARRGGSAGRFEMHEKRAKGTARRGGSAAEAVISSRPAAPGFGRQPTATSAAAAPEAPAPALPPEPTPAAAPAPAPPPVGDGSKEFAPR